nr:unnamed protein product [Callosobruchus chinensis]
MLGTRMFAGTASGATKFGKVHLGSSGVPSVRTIATSDKLRLPGHGTHQQSTEVTCLPNVRTTRAQTRLWLHDFTRCQREKRVNVSTYQSRAF